MNTAIATPYVPPARLNVDQFILVALIKQQIIDAQYASTVCQSEKHRAFYLGNVQALRKLAHSFARNADVDAKLFIASCGDGIYNDQLQGQ